MLDIHTHSRRRLGQLLKYLTMTNLVNIVEAPFTGSQSIRCGTVPFDTASIYSSYGVCVFLGMLVQLSPQPEQEKVVASPSREPLNPSSGIQYQRVSDAQDPKYYPKGEFSLP